VTEELCSNVKTSTKEAFVASLCKIANAFAGYLVMDRCYSTGSFKIQEHPLTAMAQTLVCLLLDFDLVNLSLNDSFKFLTNFLINSRLPSLRTSY